MSELKAKCLMEKKQVPKPSSKSRNAKVSKPRVTNLISSIDRKEDYVILKTKTDHCRLCLPKIHILKPRLQCDHIWRLAFGR